MNVALTLYKQPFVTWDFAHTSGSFQIALLPPFHSLRKNDLLRFQEQAVLREVPCYMFVMGKDADYTEQLRDFERVQGSLSVDFCAGIEDVTPAVETLLRQRLFSL